MNTARWIPVENWETRQAGWEDRDVPGVAVDAEDNVYVLSRDEDPLTVHRADGTRLQGWGTGVFQRPHAIRIDADGFVWCVDDGDHTVRKFARDGELLMTLGQRGRPSENGAGSAHGNYGTFDYRDVNRGGPPFNGPTDVCILSDGTVFVTDGYGNARVHRFSPEGRLELSWGEPGSGPGEFRLPHGIVAAPEEDRLFVLDRENSRIQVFDPDGRFLNQWTHFVRPCGIAISRDGMLCVGELGERAGRWEHMAPLTQHTPHGRCALVDLDGRVVERWGGDDPAAPGSFYAPHGAAFDSRGSLYVSEVSYSAGARLDDLPNGWHTLQKFDRV